VDALAATGKSTLVRGRIESIDIIRAIAVMAILLVNIGDYYRTSSPSGQLPLITSTADVWAERLLGLLVLDKFHFIFAFLFGVSSSILYENMTRRGSFWAPYLRRMAILCAFGLVNLLLLHAPDVLAVYAFNGVVLALFFRAPQWVLLTVGLVIGLGCDLGTVAVAVADHYAGAGVGQVPWLAIGVAFQSLGHTLLGCWAFRAGMLTDERRVLLVRKLFVVTATGTFLLWSWSLAITDSRLYGALDADLAIVPAIAYTAGLILLLRSAQLRRMLLPLQRYGRMALTSYITHAAFGLIVVGALASMWAMHNTVLLLLCVPIWLLQLTFSNLWLSRFSYGPLEWIWRVGTYLAVPNSRPKEPGLQQ
jgi:uncharacterized protein